MAIEQRKVDYNTEFITLIREQYKRSPRFCTLLERHGVRAQDLENALFSFRNIDTNYGVVRGVSRDSLNRTARMLGITRPEIYTEEDLLSEIKCFLVLSFSRGRIDDIKQIALQIYNYQSDVIDFEGGAYLVVYGDISSDEGKRGKLIFRCANKMMPASTKIYGIIESRFGYFGFNDFKPTANGSWLTDDSIPDPNKNMSRLVIDDEGNFINV